MHRSEQIAGLYGTYHWDTPENREWKRVCSIAKVQNITDLCSAVPHDTILDIGAGDGTNLRMLSEAHFGRSYCGIDIGESSVTLLRKNAIPGVKDALLFDGAAIPYPDKAFDLAVLSHVVEHLEHPRQLLYEAARVARHVFIEVPLEDTLRLGNDFKLDHVGHINFYSSKTIRRLVQSCGLTVVRQEMTNPPRGAYVFQKGARGLANYYVKEALLRAAPRLGAAVFTYHSAILASSH